MTSNDFFKNNNKQYDVIFIDGDHCAQQVRQDIFNALNALSPQGIILLHDVFPLFGDGGSLPFYPPLLLNGAVQLWYGHATTWSCEEQLRLSGGRRGGILDFGTAAESDKGRWVRPASIATADMATAGPNIGRDPVRPFSPDLGLEVEEGCRPCVPRPPAP